MAHSLTPTTKVSASTHKVADWLGRSAACWFASTVLGQAMFLIYIIGFYGISAGRGDFPAWSKHREVIDGYIAGDIVGNIFFGAHILMAAILTFGGALQVWPALRHRSRHFHRWNGRLFVGCSLVAALGGLWLVWIRGSMLDLASGLGITLNATFILICGWMTFVKARARQFDAHQVWAMRLFLAVSGVWFLRVGLMAVGLIGVGALGLPKSIMADFFAVWSFGNSLLPLAVYETYRRVKAHSVGIGRQLMTGTLFTLALLTLAGSLGAAMMMWLPPLRAVIGI